MIQIVSTVYCVISLFAYAAYGQGAISPRMKTCTYDEDCNIANAYCKDQSYCLCKDGFIVNVGADKAYSCLQEASKFDDMCVEDIQCTKPFGVDAVCGQGRCRCKTNAHFQEGRCYETSMLGGKCKVTNNCQIESDMGVFCDKSKCVCSQLHHPNPLGTDCIRTSIIGEACMSDAHCLTNFSVCSVVCRCKIGYVVSQDEQRCLKAADKEGDHCEENAQCNEFLHNMRCLKGTCLCDDNYHAMPPISMCWRSISLGGKCADSHECVVTSNDHQAATCSQGFCRCSSGFQPDTNDPNDCKTFISNGHARRMPRSASIINLLLILLTAKAVRC